MSDIESLRLQELAQLALGVKELKHINIAVLRCLIELLLHKLDCFNEKVTIAGATRRQLAELLENSNPKPLFAYESELKVLTDKINHQLPVVEQMVYKLEEDLSKHLLEDDCDDICNIPIEPKEKHCQILTNPFFRYKLSELVIKPLNKSLNQMAKKMNTLEKELRCFMEHELKSCYLKPNPSDLQRTFQNLEILCFTENKFQYKTYEEIQTIMDEKANNLSITEFKKEIQPQFEAIFNRLDQAKAQRIQNYAVAFIRKEKVTNLKKSVVESKTQQQNEQARCRAFKRKCL